MWCGRTGVYEDEDAMPRSRLPDGAKPVLDD